MNFKKARLEDISVKMFSGGTPSRSKKEYWENGDIPWLKTNQIGQYKIYETDEHITKVGLDNSSAKIVKKNSITVAMYGDGVTRGRVSIVGKDLTTNQACCNIELDESKADYKFVYYTLKSSYTILRHLSNGGAQQNLNVNLIKNLEILLPTLIEQKEISSVLSCLDEKIETNNKINDRLQSISQCLFNHWFVDFEFPNEEGLPYKSSGGEMVDSELGMIPRGWEVKKMGDLLIEKRVRVKDLDNKGVPEYSTTNTGIYPRAEKFKKNLSKTTGNNKVIMKDDIVFGMSREILNFSVMKEEIGSVSSAYNIFSIDKRKFIPELLEMYMRIVPSKFIDLIKPASREGQGLDKKYLMVKNIIAPNIELQGKYFSVYNDMKNLIVTNNVENANLADIRDTLLPKLMSGEIDLTNLQID